MANLPTGPLRYLKQVDSTNSEAARWADAGAPDFALVVANEQTAGRGRFGNHWHTPPDSALAFSLIFQKNLTPTGVPESIHKTNLHRYTALGAIAVSDAIGLLFSLPVEIKWPNDVLVNQRKIAGVLAEAQWEGDRLTRVIVGIGINFSSCSVPSKDKLDFPATCIESYKNDFHKHMVDFDRSSLLYSVLEKLLQWRECLFSQKFIRAWEERLAFRGQWVKLSLRKLEKGKPEIKYPLEGKLIGLTSEGQLRLRTDAGDLELNQASDVSLRPVDSSPK